MADDRVLDFEKEAAKVQERRQRAPRKPRAAGRKPVASQVEKNLAGGITFVNTIVAFTPYAADALSPEEIEKLSHALTAVLMQHPELLAWAERAADAAPYVVLAQTVISILIPRVLRRVMERQAAENPDAFASNAGAFLDLIQGGIVPPADAGLAQSAV